MTYWNTARRKINLEIMKIMRIFASVTKKLKVMDAKLDTKDTAIRVHLHHTQPVEVNEFVASVTSISNLFSSYMKENADYKEEVKAKLYVEKIKEGSIDMWLVAPTLVGLIAFADDTNKLCDFVKHINDFIAHFLNGLHPEKKYSISELQDLKEVLAPTSSDRGGQIKIDAININTNQVIIPGTPVAFDSCNSIQNQIKREIEVRKSTEVSDGVHKKVLMQIYQLRNKADSNVGNKAIIDDIFVGKKLPVVFATDELKSEILFSEANPARTGFIVDAEVMTIEGKPKAYKIVGLSDSFPLDEE